jgi:choline dehydrogenase-like flavoprotein
MSGQGTAGAVSARWDEPDVLIVGAGASGAAVAWYLAREGFKVVCLEQGGWVDPASLPALRDDWEASRHTDFNADPNVRGLREDYPVNNAASTYAPLMYNAVGGSTIHWSAHFPRFQPSDFRVRTLDGVADDWPLTYEELEPYYDLNDRMVGVAGLAGDPAHPPRSPRQTPPLALGVLGETMVRGFERLGWHWWPSDAAINSVEYNGRPGCNNCGPCDLGCATGARASADVTYWPLALQLGVDLRTHCRVREIAVDAAGRARGAIYYDAEGQLHEQRAPLVILACNGVGTPRLLLNSRSRLFPEGLANRSGLVGKNLMFHVFAVACGVFSEPLESHKGPGGSCIVSHEFYETDRARGFVRGYQLQIGRGSGPLSSAMGGLTGRRIPWGRGHHAAFDARHGHLAFVGVMGEDLPETSNEVVLDPTLTDADGIPAPLVRYRLSENSVAMLDHGIASARAVLEAAGATEVFSTSPLRTSGWHLMGTCRMGEDPATSVVDGWGRAHDVPNLFIVDGSIFVTSAVGNPTTTIQALALRTAERIRREGRGSDE